MSDAQTRAKEAAGRHAAGYVEDGMTVGLGTGSTVHWTIVELGERRPDIRCVATSERTHTLATELGLTVLAPDDLVTLDIAIDGADEVDSNFHLIKGGGGAQLREKIVAQMAARFLVVVDESKCVGVLGDFGLPLEVLPFAPGVVERRLADLGARSVTRRDQPSDNGNLLMDADFGAIHDPIELARRLEAVPGVIEHGLFLGDTVERVVVASADGVHEMERAQ